MNHYLTLTTNPPDPVFIPLLPDNTLHVGFVFVNFRVDLDYEKTENTTNWFSDCNDSNLHAKLPLVVDPKT